MEFVKGFNYHGFILGNDHLFVCVCVWGGGHLDAYTAKTEVYYFIPKVRSQ